MKAKQDFELMKGKIYSKDLGINLESGKEEETFKWFLACLLFGKPIQQEVAKRTYFEFEKAGLLTPEKILKEEWVKESPDLASELAEEFQVPEDLVRKRLELKKLYEESVHAIQGFREIWFWSVDKNSKR